MGFGGVLFGAILAGMEGGGGGDIWVGGDKVFREKAFGGEMEVTEGTPKLEGWEGGGDGVGDGGIGGMVGPPVVPQVI